MIIHKFDDMFGLRIYPQDKIGAYGFCCTINGEPTPRSELTAEQNQTLEDYLQASYPLHYKLIKG